MSLRIRSVCEEDVGALVELSLLAWAPVFSSFEQLLGPDIFAMVYPDWRKSQREGVETVCRAGGKIVVGVTESDGIAVGFVAVELDIAEHTGEVHMLAVHPADQNVGIGTQLNEWALERMKESGMRLAVLSAGGDSSHAPARRSCEKAGYTALPLVRYYKDL